MRRPGRFGTVALAGITILWLGGIWLWPPSPVTLTVDDSFYYLQTARNLAEGHGSTFDRVQPTNGYHPLWLLTLVPITGLEGDDDPVRWVLTLQLLLAVGGILWLARSRGFLRRTPVVLACILLCFYGTKVLINGQESALQWLFLCGLTAVLAEEGRDSSSARSPTLRGALVGSLGSLATLARLEAAIFGLTAAILPLLWSGREGTDHREPDGDRGDVHRTPGSRSSSPRVPAARISIPVVILGITLILYTLWNLRAFGHVLPVSAAIKSELSGVGWPAVAWALAAAIIVGGAYRRLVRRRLAGSDRDERRFRALAPLLVYCVFFGALHSSGGWRWILQIWYLAPFLLLIVAIASWALERVATGPPRTDRRVLIGVLALGAVAYLGIAVASWFHRLDPASYSTDLAARRTGRWIRDAIPPGASLAGWDIGTTAWYSRRGITNLEGLAASWAYKSRILDRNRVAGYVNEQRRIDHLVQPLPARRLTGTGSLRYGGVDLAPWRVAHADCVRFRSVVPWTRPWWRVHLVLSREGGVRLGDLQPSDVCPVSDPHR